MTEFKDNLDLFNKQHPHAPLEMESLQALQVQWTTTADGGPNVILQDGDNQTLYHPQGAKIESQEFVKLLHLENCDFLLVYGVGLGYLFEALQEWLSSHPQAHLVFLEDNKTILKAFLEGKQAKALLTHPRSRVVFIQDEQELESLFREMLKSVLIPPGRLGGAFFVALPSYRHLYFAKMDAIYSRFVKEIENIERQTELRYFESGVFRNHMLNFVHYPRSYHIQAFLDAFKGIPAIICGGGSSLEDHFDFLRQIEGRALIIGVGAGSNILGEQGIVPHLTFGVDPTFRHSARLASQACYEVPLIYTTRAHFRGLEIIQAPLVLTPFEEEGAHTWMNKQLKLQRTEPLSGVSVGNFAAAILQRMGCSPIFFLGIDLALTKEQKYAKGWFDYPLIAELKECLLTDLAQSIFGVREREDDLEHKRTTNQFLIERYYYSELASACPQTKFFNLSADGLDIPNMPRLSIQEAFDGFLGRTFDLRGQVHALMVQSALSTYRVTLAKVAEQFDKWYEHLDHSFSWCQRIADRLEEECMLDEKNNIDPEEIIKFEKKINRSPVYENFLKSFELSFEEIQKFKTQWWGEQTSHARTWIECYRHLADCTASALKLMEGLRLKFRWDESYAPQRFPALCGVAREFPGEGDLYSITEKEFTLIDWELELSYHEPLETERGHFCFDESFYPNGGLQSKVGRCEGALHGPSTFYSENGEVLALSWFIKGEQQGKSWRYYPSGALYSVERYRDGVRHRNQEYFFENGILRTLLPYDKGKLHGQVQCYHRNGMKKREIPYVQHARIGIEHLWDEKGALRGHVKYKNNQPAGTACAWFEDGTQQLEISYFSEGVIDYIDEWNEKGDCVHEQRLPLNSSLRQVDEMIDKMQRLQSQFEQLSKQLPTSEELEKYKDKTALEADLIQLNEEMKKLQKFFHAPDEP